ncbi:MULTISPECIES: LuxR family transcriptional regulator [unclassified Serratia (in: enterobacteria)]|uniref:helix-turn-helix transcriptional regulator n=1 Tax=unclassified Serratia (in: enterobacteria) TaxID=2647522 RepID=UPI000502749A|nr:MULTISPECIES: LuxR family transcriptional regulator [unclassified Serratia (in: enterobacteria)]KFK93758.1 LuxR family transcriptional regulator [Serratia sp. Ag2]KFK98875.1 LuxR family transcriptional regulator [Serratia sp. Ag1]
MSDLFFNNDFINATIENYLERKLAEYKNINFVYGIINKRNPANIAIISNKKEWFEVYKENNYQFIDPVVITATQRVTPFPWDENIMINSGLKLSRIFDMAKDYGVINGYTFVLHDYNHNLAVLSILIDKQCGGIIEEIDNNKHKLQMLLLTVHEKLTTLYQELNGKVYFEAMNNQEIFSKRENEIIYWASVGKSYQEIASLLGIKLTTVKYHIGNAVKKLGVTNAKHAIRLGIELQLIRPVLPDAES